MTDELLKKLKEIDSLCLLAFEHQKYGWIVHVNKIKEIVEDLIKENN